MCISYALLIIPLLSPHLTQRAQNMDYIKPLSKDHKILGRGYCSGYVDSYDSWNNGFNCPQSDATTTVYCCGTPTYQYCCTDKQNITEGNKLIDYFRRTPASIGVISALTLLTICVTVVSCYFCSCCIVYKKRQAQLSGGLYRIQGSSSTGSTLGNVCSPSSALNSIVTTPLDSEIAQFVHQQPNNLNRISHILPPAYYPTVNNLIGLHDGFHGSYPSARVASLPRYTPVQHGTFFPENYYNGHRGTRRPLALTTPRTFYHHQSDNNNYLNRNFSHSPASNPPRGQNSLSPDPVTFSNEAALNLILLNWNIEPDLTPLTRSRDQTSSLTTTTSPTNVPGNERLQPTESSGNEEQFETSSPCLDVSETPIREINQETTPSLEAENEELSANIAEDLTVIVPSGAEPTLANSE